MRQTTFHVIGRMREAGGNWVEVGLYVKATSEEEALRIARERCPEPEHEWERTIRFPDDWWGNEV